jgi:hypothetical protein
LILIQAIDLKSNKKNIILFTQILSYPLSRIIIPIPSTKSHDSFPEIDLQSRIAGATARLASHQSNRRPAKPASHPEHEEEEYDDALFYEDTRAPKFADLTTPDAGRPTDDASWFCLRVGKPSTVARLLLDPICRSKSPVLTYLQSSPACGPHARGDGPATTAELRGAASVQQDVRPR